MQRREFLTLAAAAGVAAPLRAADVAGAWESETESPMGYSRTLYRLNVEGGKITGTIFNDRSGEASIAEGKVDGDNVEFTVEMSRGPRTITLLFQGTVSGDEMELTREFQLPAGGQGRPGGGQGRPGGGQGGGGGRGGRGGGMGRGPQEVYATRLDEQGMLAWEEAMKEYAANPPEPRGGGRGGRRGGPPQ